MSLLARLDTVCTPLVRVLAWLQPAFVLAVRLYVASVFFKSGLTKIASMDSTIMLFTYEYQVPLLSPTLAAYLGTGAELVLPVLLALGLGGRLAAAALFVFNIIAVISYPDLNEVGVMQHQYWGVLLLLPLLYGPGKLSIDCFIKRRLSK
ncbi:MAG TPA: DoxX family membrane protein [Acidiferrobacterales bacterium]|nr:DoxX family membrane protein [Acidiferrobacterales bacterium]